MDGTSLEQFTFIDSGQINVPPDLRPVDIFRLIVDSDIIDLIGLETNRNARRYKINWKDVSA